jgi:type I restriction enzyme S subunit
LSDTGDNIPDGWAETTLSELLTHKSGNSKLIKGKLYDRYAVGRYQGFSASGADVWCDTFEHEGDAIIVSAVGARCGKAFRASGKWSAIANTHIVWSHKGALDIDFAHYLLNDEKFWEKGGSAQPFVKTNATFERPFQLPPLPEQRRIVTKIEALQACSRKAREALEAIPPLLEQFRQSVLAAAFRGDLTADWREQHPDVEPASVLLERIQAERRRRWEQAELSKFKAKGKVPKDDSWKEKYVEPDPVDDADLPELPEGWCWVALEQLATHKSGLAFRSQDFTDEGVQVVKLGTLYQGRFDLTRDPAYLPTDHPELEDGLVRPGDLLVSQTGTRFKRDYGHFVPIPDNSGPLVLNQRVLAVTVAIPIIQKWVEFASRTDAYRDHLFASETGGVNQGNVGIAGIMRGPIPLAPLDEILKIVGLLEQSIKTSHSVQQIVETQLQELGFANQSILAKAFRGELVPQDPNDEPASVLLQRIRAERADDTNGKPARGRRK